MNDTHTIQLPDENLQNLSDLDIVAILESRLKNAEPKNRKAIKAVEGLESLLKDPDYHDRSFVQRLSENKKIQRYCELSHKDYYSEEESDELDVLLKAAEDDEHLALGFGCVDHALAHDLGLLEFKFRAQYKKDIQRFMKRAGLPNVPVDKEAY